MFNSEPQSKPLGKVLVLGLTFLLVLTLLITLSGSAIAQSFQLVQWINAVNVAVDGNNLTKNEGREIWNADAVSENVIPSGN